MTRTSQTNCQRQCTSTQHSTTNNGNGHSGQQNKNAPKIQQTTVAVYVNNTSKVQQDYANRTCGSLRKNINRKQLRQTTRRIKSLESEVHQAMTVIDEDTGRLLNYKQLIQDPK